MDRSTKQDDVTIGLDLGDRRSQAAVLDAGGVMIEERSVATTKEGMAEVFGQYGGCRIVMEVGTHSPWVSRLFKERGFEVIVANPRQVRLIAASQRKTDRFDAQMLARLGRVDPALLAPVQHRGVEAQQHRAMMQARDGLVRCRTLLINQVRGLTKAMGVRLPRSGAGAFACQARATLGDKQFLGLDTLLSTIEQLSSDIRAMDKQVKELIESTYPEAAHLQQVSGVGPITSLWYLLTLEDPSRFAKSRVVGAYLGLCPGQRSSGEQRPQLGISKAGDETLRRYLVQAAHCILGPLGPDTDLRRFGQAISSRGGSNGKKRAVVAVARKLAVLLHRLWVTGETYVPLRNADLTASQSEAA